METTKAVEIHSQGAILVVRNISAWTVQYLLWVPAVLVWRLLAGVAGFAFKVGLFGILLLLLPVIGWIILAIWMTHRHDERMVQLLVEQKTRRSIFKPWFTA